MSQIPLRLYTDIQNRVRVKSFTDAGKAGALTLRQGEQPTIYLAFLDNANATAGEPFTSYYKPSGLGIKLGISQTVTGGTDDLLAFQDTWSADGNGFSARLNLNTSEIATALATAGSIPAYLEIETTEPADYPIKWIQERITIQAGVIDDASMVPVPVSEFYTKNEALATFLKKTGAAGEEWVSTSPNGLWQRVMGVNDDGTRKDDVIEL